MSYLNQIYIKLTANPNKDRLHEFFRILVQRIDENERRLAELEIKLAELRQHHLGGPIINMDDPKLKKEMDSFAL